MPKLGPHDQPAGKTEPEPEAEAEGTAEERDPELEDGLSHLLHRELQQLASSAGLNYGGMPCTAPATCAQWRSLVHLPDSLILLVQAPRPFSYRGC